MMIDDDDDAGKDVFSSFQYPLHLSPGRLTETFSVE